MSDLRDFAKNFSSSKDNEKEQAFSSAKNIYDKYKDYSEGDLTSEIEKLILNQKRNGTFNKSALISSLNGFSSFIPQDKLNGLKELIERIDSKN